MQALKIAATGMSAQQLRVNTISNNLANMSTTGYNARRAEFADLHYQQVSRAGAVSASDGSILPTGVQVGLGVRPAAVSVHLQQGALKETGGDLDIAIEGEGYFEVELPNGESGYTRDGGFKRSADGLIVTNDGFPVAPQITIPDDAISIAINADGEVYAHFDDAVASELLGQFTLVGFSNAKGLEAVGSNLFRETEASGAPFVSEPSEDGLGTLNQGYLEGSSVDSVREITELIEAQRGYEMNAKVISAVDQMLSATTQVR
ncbi:flagellar basal-body rod protein FlgG [Shimia haliotis]|uniref:Flagellar basal-body rod protein FlgG n=1 Tax=Shimia haliotis TaxID=1280847 RepID=A0A1I4DF35_9RHOB|nr:flagellar basal-body rod protein FlgG [Shimia haliotis]SFK91057.1 flagellar basal-body rod protein FlgG [Shimia haliotis]